MTFIPIPKGVWNDETLVSFLVKKFAVKSGEARTMIAVKEQLTQIAFIKHPLIVANSFDGVLLFSLKGNRIVQSSRFFGEKHVVAIRNSADIEELQGGAHRFVRRLEASRKLKGYRHFAGSRSL